MRTRPLGPSGIEASVIGLGTWAISIDGKADNNIIIVKSAKEAVEKAIALVDSRM